MHRLSLATLAERLYRALKNKPCACGGHAVTTTQDGAMKRVIVYKTCQSCRVIEAWESSEFYNIPTGS